MSGGSTLWTALSVAASQWAMRKRLARLQAEVYGRRQAKNTLMRRSKVRGRVGKRLWGHSRIPPSPGLKEVKMDKDRVLRLLCEGASNEEIAQEMGYTRSYIAKVFSELMVTYGANHRAHLAAIYLRKEVRRVA